jgi:AcrR family transcriptional regulator
MRRRAEQVDDTRQRIIRATVQLHETVGPAATTIAGIAAQAGVTRLTVYRHFPDDAALYFACSAHWLSLRRVPAPDAWAAIDDLGERVHAGLADIYRFYREGESMLSRIYRDIDLLPEPLRAGINGREERWVTALVGKQKRARLCAAVGHAVAFSTWRSLCTRQRLSNDDAAQMMTELVVMAAARSSRRS